MKVWLLSISALDAVDVAVTLRFASGQYKDPAGFFWESRIKQPGLFNGGLYGGQVIATEQSGFGETTLINADGALDYLADYAVDGREVILSLYDGTAVTQILRATAAKLQFEKTLISVRLRDPSEALNRAHPMNRYAGTNVLPDGLEGTADNIGGLVKPILFGECVNAQPKLVNTSKLIYQISDRNCTVSAVYDRGVALTNGGAYADLATLQSTAPTAGQYRAFQGYFRIGASATGTITCDAATAAPNAGDVLADVLSDISITVEAADTTALNAFGAVRLWIDQQVNTVELVNRIIDSVGGFWRFSSFGVFRSGIFAAPASPTQTIQPYEVIEITRESTGSGPSGLPVWSVTYNADRIEFVQTDFAGAVPETLKAKLAEQTRATTAEDAAVLTRHPLADKLIIDSALSSITEAASVASTVLGLVKVRRDLVTVIARIDDFTAITIGSIIKVKTSRLGYSAGRDFIVIGRQIDASRNRLELRLWG